MKFIDVMLEKIYGKNIIDECELETLRLDNARLREENENLKVSFRSDTKLLNEKEDEIFNLHSEIEKLEQYLNDKNKEIDFYKKEVRESKQALYRLKEEITTYLESLPI